MKSFVNELQKRIKQLEQENAQLKMHAPYGILTRAAFEIEKRKFTDGQFVVFGDVDKMHEANTRYGYETVNAKIRTALNVRSDDLLLTGLYFSGDEIVFIVRGDADGFCNRISESFVAQGLNITLAGAQIVDGEIDIAIQMAAAEVQNRKAIRK